MGTRALSLLIAAMFSMVSSSPRLSVSAFQANRTAPLQERLNRIGKELVAGPARLESAIKELKEILAVDPGSAQAHLLLGIAYRMKGSPELIGEAAAELRQALAIDPNLVPARFYLARVYLDLGRLERAQEELIAALERQPGHPQFVSLLGETERQRKNPARAVELIQQALKADPSSGQARYYLGLALFDLGRRDEAITALESVAASGTTELDVYSSLGSAYIDAGRLDDAVAVLTKAARLDPARPDLRILLARAYRSKGLLDRAAGQLKLVSSKGIEGLASGFQQQQLDFDLELERGALALAGRRLPAAVAALRKTLAMDPNHGPANRYLAEAYLLQGSIGLAAEHARLAEKFGAPLPPAARQLLHDKLHTQGTGKQK